MKIVIKTFLIILILQLSLQAREININEIVKSATKSNKHLFVWLHKTDCGYCESMREFTLENDIVKLFIEKNFIFVHINVWEKDKVIYKDSITNGRDFAKNIGYDFYPTSLFFDDNAEMIYAEVGYKDNEASPNEKRFLTILNYINSKSYKTMDYEDYEFDIQEEL